MSETNLDPKRQEQAKIYARISRKLLLVDFLLAAIYILVWLVSGWSIELRNYLMTITSNQWLLVPVFALILGGIYFLIDLPLSYFSEYVLPHRFDISTQTIKSWIIDLIKGLLLSGVMGGILIEIIYWVLRIAPQTWWLLTALILLIFNVLLTNLAPILIMPLFNKFVPLGEDHAELAERLTRLAERANVKIQGVYKFDMSSRTKSANAALTGMGNTRRIILGDTLINEFSADEIETVLAHELGHQVHKDIPLMIVFGTVITTVGLYLASVGLNWGVRFFGLTGPADVAGMPLFALVLGAFGLITMPLQNGFSRWRERLADEYALFATGKGDAFASALTRLANQNLAEADPDPLVEFFLYSHPALSKRIRMAQNFTQSHSKVQLLERP
ncbi:MAG TPA: M48 family metallopeptidase [Anaerolineaceae bacterium]|nr:M48 family metallopeptidase [Anaerolineaceae bacterium]